MAPQVKLIQTLVPDLKAVGYVYSAGEVNSAIVLEVKTRGSKTGLYHSAGCCSTPVPILALLLAT